ncbi:ATP-binding protein [Roseateles sp. SL47]|uniref:ATP-binding protein n=1 Tax=Roseateles sp. SL47 TaxID=2995138 RepID=UPI0022713655|nr:ATP-binding protein [Roseateles sp. SL47]WAC73061.1 ATP-binding protein [Roseateles sp. SL47]
MNTLLFADDAGTDDVAGAPEAAAGGSVWPDALPAALYAAWEAVTTPVLVHDDTRVVYANGAGLRLLGYSDVQLATMRFDGWATPEHQPLLRDYAHAALGQTDQLAPAMEIEALTGSGVVRVLELTARSFVHESRPFNVMTLQDLSDMRFVQTSLLNVGRVLHQIIENSPVASFVLDAEHRVTHWNAACAKLTGRDGTDMLGSDEAWTAFYQERRPLLSDMIIHSASHEDYERAYGGACRRSAIVDNAYEVESYFPDMQDGGRWLFFTAAPLLDAQGKVVGAIETLQDVTQRRRSDEELRRHRAELEDLVAERTAELLLTHHELEAFLENASVGIITTQGARIQRGNRKFAEMFELGDELAGGQPTRRFFPNEESLRSLLAVAGPVLKRGDSLRHEMELVSLKGKRLWVQLIAYVANPQAETTHTWWLLQDRTEERRVQMALEENFERIKSTNTRLEEAQNQLLQAEKMASIGQLAAGVAHEINNPIGFVSSNLHTLRGYVEPVFALLDELRQLPPQSLPDPAARDLKDLDKRIDLDFVKEDLPQLLDESEDGLIRVKKIVQDLKDFSRVDHAEWQDANLNAGLDSTLNVVMNEVKYKAEVKRDYEDLPPVRCIAAQLNQVFMNLIVNAAHAIPQRGEIRLRTAVEGEWVRIEVEDTGSGMTEDVRRRIFEPFFTTKPVGKGTGLGLSLSYSIIQKHAGRVEVESTPGVGTTFKVWIPIRPPSGAGEVAAVQATPASAALAWAAGRA